MCQNVDNYFLDLKTFKNKGLDYLLQDYYIYLTNLLIYKKYKTFKILNYIILLI